MQPELTHAAYTKRLLDVQDRLFAYIVVFAPDRNDAADILQETNTVLLRKQHEFNEGTDYWFWACKVAYFEVLTFRKRRNRNRMLNVDDHVLQNFADEAAVALMDVDTRVVALRKCIEKAPPASRDLIRFRYQQDLSADAIAARLGQTALAVRQALFRLREKLEACINRQLSAGDAS